MFQKLKNIFRGFGIGRPNPDKEVKGNEVWEMDYDEGGENRPDGYQKIRVLEVRSGVVKAKILENTMHEEQVGEKVIVGRDDIDDYGTKLEE